MIVAPRVSVVIPAYNVSAYIQDALISLEQQSFDRFEVVIVDDGSTDRTAEMVKPFCDRDARFRLLQKTNGGLSSARNYGIRHAQAEYIALLDGDDAYEPDKLANHVALLDRHPAVGVVYSASKVMRDSGELTFMSLSGKPVNANPEFALLCKNFVGHGSNAVFRRSLIEEVGEFDETLRSSEDVDFWLRIAATGNWQFHREPQALCRYRVRPTGLSFNVRQMQQSHEQVMRSALARSPHLAPLLPTAFAYMYRFLARLSLTAGHPELARRYLLQALQSDYTIFLRDPRSLLTLVAVGLSPMARLVLKRTLAS